MSEIFKKQEVLNILAKHGCILDKDNPKDMKLLDGMTGQVMWLIPEFATYLAEAGMDEEDFKTPLLAMTALGALLQQVGTELLHKHKFNQSKGERNENTIDDSGNSNVYKLCQ